MGMRTRYQVKAAIHDYLMDDYCMSQKEVYEFIDCMSSDVIDSLVFKTHYLMLSIVDSMIRWGNKKVEKVAMSL